ncbi:hypothetical protein FGRMN_10108, partial [Fusarium graminum]
AQQIISQSSGAAGTAQSEDCLTQNTWSKATLNSAKADKPVLVFFYGERLAIGNVSSPFYNGKYFAEAEDIVVITVNYRIKIFGFPDAPGEKQNMGLRDQIAAVEWVRDNIWQFGSNPSKITIVGQSQSSGGVAVDYWTYAYKKDPIVNGIIASSGNAFSFPSNTVAVQEKEWNSVVAALGCDTADDVMRCMREADWKDIKAAAAAIEPTPSSIVLRATPPFWPKAGSESAKARRDRHVPSWAYRYMADWNNTRLFPTSGAYHGVDLHMIFGASGDVSSIEPSAEQKKLTKMMQHAWFSFNNDPWSGLSKLGWAEFDPNDKTVVELGKDAEPRVDFVKPSVYDLPCSTVTMGALPTSL